MKLELKENMYVRTKDGYISQYKYYDYDIGEGLIGKLLCIPLNNGTFANIENIKKFSYNIIDILEKGDYVNGLPVECVEGTRDDENDKRVYYGVATYGYKSNLPYHTYIVKDEFENDYNLRFRCIKPNEIKSIVTKEQMEQIAYKVGE